MAEDKTQAQDISRAHIYISGLVQGVFFRNHARQRALSLKVAGWVRNCSDGRVEAVFEGAKDAVEDMIDWSHQGPPSSVVEKVEVEREKGRAEFRGFEVRY